MDKEKTKHRITVGIDESAFENLSFMANENSVSIAWVIRYAVDNLLKERKEGRHQQLILPLEIKTNDRRIR